jgi:hypothetical protein
VVLCAALRVLYANELMQQIATWFVCVRARTNRAVRCLTDCMPVATSDAPTVGLYLSTMLTVQYIHSAYMQQPLQLLASVITAVLTDYKASTTAATATTIATVRAVSQQHVRKLKSMFDSIDLGGSGSIDCQEFLDHIDVPRSPFTDVVFKMVGLDPKGSVSFSPLLCMVTEYCMFTRDEILRCELCTFY